MKILFTLLFVLLVMGGAFWMYLSSCATEECLYFEWQKVKMVSSFETCASLGFPIMESYPRQCRAGDTTYTEEISGDPSLNEQPGEVSNENIEVSSPVSGALVQSPLTITGRARGPWYFEASFPVMILDANGEKLGAHYAQAEGEWMTTEFVPFTSTLEFTAPTTATGTLVLLKDNPSGLPEHEDSISIPIRFE